jgi:hypothetical protein
LTACPLQKEMHYLVTLTYQCAARPATDLCIETALQPGERATEQANKRKHQFAQFSSLYARSFSSRPEEKDKNSRTAQLLCLLR